MAFEFYSVQMQNKVTKCSWKFFGLPGFYVEYIWLYSSDGIEAGYRTEGEKISVLTAPTQIHQSHFHLAIFQ
jgi:hypothetical protein